MILLPVALVLLLSSRANQAILTAQNSSVSPISSATHSDSFVGAAAELSQPQQQHQQQQQQQNSDSTNTTFYYEANAFLIDDQSNGRPKYHRSASDQNQNQNQRGAEPAGQHVGAANSSLQLQPPPPPPASMSMTSGRNGRMMDLDALMGDFAASQANKALSQSGNRQSRYLSAGGSPSLEVAGGKRLHIQGFIPIVGVKDVTGADEEGGAGSSSSAGSSAANEEQAARLQQQLQLQFQLQRQQQQLQQLQQQQQAQTSELPYAQSSIGHASFGVQRYLSTGDQQQQRQLALAPAQQVDAKFSGAASSVIDSIRRPIKRLAGGQLAAAATATLASEPLQQAANSAQSQQQNCLCVPFYMCKNGYISESSLGKSQIQQMILQQQQQQLAAPKLAQLSPDQQVEMKSGQAAPTLQQQQQPQYADSYAPVDERSLDRDIITAAPSLLAGDQFAPNQTASAAEDYAVEAAAAANGPPQQGANSSEPASAGDYSEEILGRMLGLRASNSRISSGSQQQQPATGACGLLRSCCNIPAHLFPSQQDLANERLLGQLSQQQQSSSAAPSAGNKYQQQQQQQQLQLHQQFALAALRQQQQAGDFGGGQSFAAATTKLPYGFPGASTMRMQPLNTLNPNSLDSLLAHRSTQFAGQASPATQLARYQPAPLQQQQQPQQQQLAQYARATPQLQQLYSFQQQQQQLAHQQGAKAVPLGATAAAAAAASSVLANSAIGQQQQQLRSQLAGSRKILDGRCGLRQSAGITGRVQSLQYHESSADFGEYPAQAAILKRLSGSDSLFVCGGTLISQYWVATAAHCVRKHAQGDLKVRLGEWDVHRDDEFYPHVEKEVRDLVVHPEFIAGNLVNDIALLRLDSPVDPSLPHVNPACLPGVDESFAGQRCWVTGWGKDSFGQKGSFQAVLREVELPVVGRAECESALRQTRLGQHYRLHAGFVCAGGEGGRDACEGDGGSGLYCVQPDGLIKVAGLVSWGIGCGQAGVPGVYVSLAHYRSWIENIISIDEDIYSPYANMISSSLISERSNAAAATTNSSSTAATLATPATTETLAPPPEQQAPTTAQPNA